MRLSKLLAASVAALFLVVDPALASEGVAQGSSAWMAWAPAIAIAFAALGGTISQGKTASSALEAIGRNPGAAGQLFTPMILGLVFIESLVIFSWVIAFMLVGKV